MHLPLRLTAGLRRRAWLAACLCLGATAQALAQDATPWWLRVGAARVTFQESVTLRAAGAVVPGAGAEFSDRNAILAELGYRFTPNWSAGLMVGIPPTTTIAGTGSAAALGTLGRVKFGPVALTAQYRFAGVGKLQPYLGAGVAYSVVVRSSDGAVTDFDVDNSWGSVLQAGAEFNLTPALGLFVDAKKIFLKSKARGNAPALGGAPVTADATLNPLVIAAGVVFRF